MKAFVFFLIFSFSILIPVHGGDELLPQTTLDKTFIFHPASESGKPAVYENLKRWVVEEETDKVQRALEVYKKKGESQYNRRIWLTDRGTGQKRLVVEYAAKGDGKVVFSPNEDFMYYLGLTPAGGSIIYGIDLATNQKFTLGTGSDFRSVSCPDKKNYVVVHQQEGKRQVTQVFTTTGERVKTVTDPMTPLDIEKSLCR